MGDGLSGRRQRERRAERLGVSSSPRRSVSAADTPGRGRRRRRATDAERRAVGGQPHRAPPRPARLSAGAAPPCLNGDRRHRTPAGRPGSGGRRPPLGVALAGELAVLARAELLFLALDGRGVLGGVPFAAAPTAHQVSVHGGPTVSASCAVAALGIGAMLGRHTDVRSVDPASGAPITASERGGQWTWQPADAVVFVGSSGDGAITDACCPIINFFANATNALGHQQSCGLTGEVRSMSEAARGGALVFGGLLAESTS